MEIHFFICWKLQKKSQKIKLKRGVLQMENRTQELIEIARRYVEEAEADAERNPTSEKIQVVIVEPEKEPYKTIIDNSLDVFQKIVCGYIEHALIGRTKKGAKISIHLNEEGKLDNLPFNRNVIGFDVLVGTFFITAFNLEGNYISLTDEECDHYIKRFTPLEVYL
jgi:hypothetical protein